MSFTNWANDKVKKMDWTDIALTKLSVFAFALMIARLYQPIMSVDWYWYALVFIVAAVKPLVRAFI